MKILSRKEKIKFISEDIESYYHLLNDISDNDNISEETRRPKTELINLPNDLEQVKIAHLLRSKSRVVNNQFYMHHSLDHVMLAKWLIIQCMDEGEDISTNFPELRISEYFMESHVF